MRRRGIAVFVVGAMGLLLSSCVGAGGGYIHDPEWTGPKLMPGQTNATPKAAVRWKAQNSGNEIYLGIHDLGVGGNRTEVGYTWANGTYPVTFSFDGTQIHQTISGATLDYTVVPNALLPGTPACPISGWNVMNILLRDSVGASLTSPGGGLAFNGVTVNGTPLMGGDLGTVDVAGSPGAQYWTVSMVDFSQPWTVTGNLVTDNWQGGGNEALRLELSVGCSI